MYAEGLSKFYWGFLFIMVDFRLFGIDVLPDIAGYILFAVGLNLLASASDFFARAKSLNIPMLILSLFSIYEAPAQGEGIHIAPLWPLGLLIGIASIILTLMVVYNLFKGIKELADRVEQHQLAGEAEKRWNQFLSLQLAVALAFLLIFFPPLALLYLIVLLIASIALVIAIMGFIKRCEQSL